jgi:PAT family acetyl-CoA transporter-like MFS transporter 1
LRKQASAADTVPVVGWRQDIFAISLLLLLYTLQGVPMGIASAVPFLMQKKNLRDSDQGKFSFASWPFSLKLLWAPLVDSLYHSRFGRRKTWIVPAQLAIGALLLWAAPHIDVWLGEGGGVDVPVEVGTLTMLFFAFFFLAATQDIAVDGLALTILSPANKELGATCNTIGQSFGYLISSTGFLALYSPEFCNAYLRPAAAFDETHGLVTLGGFMLFWGWVFLASTLWVALLSRGDEHMPLRGSLGTLLRDAYEEMWLVLRLPAVRSMALALLTCRAALGVFGSATSLRITQAGMPKEHLAIMVSVAQVLGGRRSSECAHASAHPFALPTPLCPQVLGMGVQLYVSGRFLTTGAAGEEAKPLHIFARLYPARLLMGLVALTLVTVVGAHRGSSGGLPYWLYAVVTLSILVQVAVQETGFVAIMAFFNRVADPSIGGTYMTMLNTIANLGAAWPNTAALFLIDAMHHTRPCSCEPPATAGALQALAMPWQALGKSIGKVFGVAVAAPCKCKPEVLIDGYTATCMLSLLVGVAWFVLVRPRLFALQALPPSAWLARRVSV